SGGSGSGSSSSIPVAPAVGNSSFVAGVNSSSLNTLFLLTVSRPDSTALPVKTIGEAQRIANEGVPPQVLEENNIAGPDVTHWYAADLIIQLDHRLKHEGVRDFKHQAADLMSYKWINFGSPATGPGVNTVVLGNMVIAKKQLG